MELEIEYDTRDKKWYDYHNKESTNTYTHQKMTTPDYNFYQQATEKPKIALSEEVIQEICEYLPTIDEMTPKLRSNLVEIENVIKIDSDSHFMTLSEFLKLRYDEGNGYTYKTEKEAIAKEFIEETREEIYPTINEEDEYRYNHEYTRIIGGD